MATSQVALSSVLGRWGLLGSWQEAEPNPPNSVRPPLPFWPTRTNEPSACTDRWAGSLETEAGAELAQVPASMWEKNEHKHMHAACLPPFPRCTPTCAVCTCEFLDLKGGLAFMHVNHEEMAFRCARDGSSNGVSGL